MGAGLVASLKNMNTLQDITPFKAEARHGMKPSTFWSLAFSQAAERDERIRNSSAEEDFWKNFAPEYDQRSPLAQQADEMVGDLVGLLQPSDHLVEIGPGTGAFTRRLAGHVEAITGIEPSLAMQTELFRHWETHHGPQPRMLSSRWEEISDLACEVVFGSNAFYRMEDMASSIVKMHRFAARRVILIQSVGAPYAPPLQVRQNGRHWERDRADALSDVLDELGLAHDMQDYSVERAPGTWGKVALITWETD